MWNHSIRAVAQLFMLVFTPWSLTWCWSWDWKMLDKRGSNDEIECMHFQGCSWCSFASDGSSLCGQGGCSFTGIHGQIWKCIHSKTPSPCLWPKIKHLWTITVLTILKHHHGWRISNIPKFHVSMWMKLWHSSWTVLNIQCCYYRWFSDPTKSEKSWLLERLEFSLNELSNRGYYQSYCRMFHEKICREFQVTLEA